MFLLLSFLFDKIFYKVIVFFYFTKKNIVWLKLTDKLHNLTILNFHSASKKDLACCMGRNNALKLCMQYAVRRNPMSST